MWWDRQTQTWEVLPSGTDVPLVMDSELETYCSREDVAALRACAARLRQSSGCAVVFGRVLDLDQPSGWHCRVFFSGDFDHGN